MSILQRFSGQVTEYDQRRFVTAVDAALDEWLQNELYRKRFENSDAPRELETLDDIVELPVVDMREFKQHPRELVIDREQVDESHAVYSSGTTSDTKSFALRSAARNERQKRIFRAFSDELFPEFDYATLLVPDPATLESLPPEQSRRALFRYVQWLFEENESDYYVDISPETGLEPRFEELIEDLETRDDDIIIFGPPVLVNMLADTIIALDQHVSLGDNGAVLTGGGWKDIDGETIEFREKLTSAFGIQSREHLDLYSATELSFGAGNAYGQEDPDLKRLPRQGFFYVADTSRFVSDGALEPVRNGEAGLMVAVDPINTDYPGVILTDDIVRKTGGRYGENVRMEYVRRFTG